MKIRLNDQWLMMGAVALILSNGISNPVWAVEATPTPKDGWTVVASISIPGQPTRFDYQSQDPRSGRLYLAHLGDSRLIVVDPVQGRVVGDLAGFENVHGVLLVPERDRVYATVSSKSRRKRGSLVVVDARNLTILTQVPTGIHPDGLDYEPRTGRIFVSNEWGKSLSVIDANTNQPVGRIPLRGEVGNTRVDHESHRVFATVQTRNLLVRIDPYALHVDRAYRLPCRHPHGLVIDEEARAAYVACEGDDRLLSVDLHTGSVLSNLPTGRKPDVLSLDQGRGLLFVASESGDVSVYRKNDHGLSLLSTTFLGKGAHSILADPRTHLLYLPLENENGAPVLKVLKWQGQ